MAEQIQVEKNAGLFDTIKAAGRYLVVIFTVFPALLALLKAHDIGGIIDFLRGNQGAAFLAAVVGLGTLAYGLFKTHQRAATLVSAAADPANANVIPK